MIFEECLQESNTGVKINGNIYIHCLESADHGFAGSRTFLVCAIKVYPSARLLMDCVFSGFGRVGISSLGGGGEWLGWRGASQLHMIPHRLGSEIHCTTASYVQHI
jgi:hypothetical protein